MNSATMKEMAKLALMYINGAEDIINEIRAESPCAAENDEWDNLADGLETVRADMEHIMKEWGDVA
jgi:hypothetical protein